MKTTDRQKMRKQELHKPTAKNRRVQGGHTGGNEGLEEKSCKDKQEMKEKGEEEEDEEGETIKSKEYQFSTKENQFHFTCFLL